MRLGFYKDSWLSNEFTKFSWDYLGYVSVSYENLQKLGHLNCIFTAYGDPGGEASGE